MTTRARPQQQVRLSPEVKARLELEAKRRCVSATLLASWLIEDGLGRLVPVERLRAMRSGTDNTDPEEHKP